MQFQILKNKMRLACKSFTQHQPNYQLSIRTSRGCEKGGPLNELASYRQTGERHVILHMTELQ